MTSNVGEGATPLMYACQQSREREVLDILARKPKAATERDRTLKTPLHYCAESSSIGCAEAILRVAPQLLDAKDEDGYTPLHLAVISGNKILLRLLISKGSNVNALDNEKHSPVHWATVCGEQEALEMILRAGANISTADIHGGYPLHYAAQMCGPGSEMGGDPRVGLAVLRALLSYGVDINVQDKDGRQPILWAASAGSADAILALVNAGASVEAADKDGLTALHCAASRGHTDCLETLVALCGANVDVIDSNGCTALFYAATLGHADSTQLLLSLGAEPNRQDRKGRTPAHCGAAKGQLETLRILLSHGANLWLRNVKGDFPLHEAVASGRKELVRWLLNQRPDAVNVANNDGRCPIHVAAINNNVEMIKILFDAQSLVNPIMRTSRGVLMTPLDTALYRGNRSCAKYLQLHGGVPFSKLNETASNLRGAAPRQVAAEPQLERFAAADGLPHGRLLPTGPSVAVKQVRMSDDIDAQPPLSGEMPGSDQHTGRRRCDEESSGDERTYRRRRRRRRSDQRKKDYVSSEDSESEERSQDSRSRDRPRRRRKESEEDDRRARRHRKDKSGESSSDGKGGRRRSRRREDSSYESEEENGKDYRHGHLGKKRHDSDSDEMEHETEKKSKKEDVKHDAEGVVEPGTETELKDKSEMETTVTAQLQTVEVQALVHLEPPEIDDQVISTLLENEDAGEVESLKEDIQVEERHVVEVEEADKEPVGVADGVADGGPEPEPEHEKEVEVDNSVDVLEEETEDKEAEPFSTREMEEMLAAELDDLQEDSMFTKTGKTPRESFMGVEEDLYDRVMARPSEAEIEEDRKIQKAIGSAEEHEGLTPSGKRTAGRPGRRQATASSRKRSTFLTKTESEERDEMASRMGDVDTVIKSVRLGDADGRSTSMGDDSGGSTRNEDSSVLLDSGIEPSPRRGRKAEYDMTPKREVETGMSRRSRVPRLCREGKDEDDLDVQTISVTQAVQNTIRKYHLERRVFYQLLELKRLQIKAGRANEHVLVKRLVDEHRRAGLVMGLQHYTGVYTFRDFETFLYGQLHMLQSTGHLLVPKIKPSDDIETLSTILKKTRVQLLDDIPDNPIFCTHGTHRCHHAAHAYTGIPCAAYITKLNHHEMPKTRNSGFLPRIDQSPTNRSASKRMSFRPVTLELTHGREKQVISLPTDRLDKNKRYYVTFTIKGGPTTEESRPGSTGDGIRHRHAKSF